MESNEFSKIRHDLKMTQKQLSQVLCVSLKAIQSFEQGWRNIPTLVERELLLLFSMKQYSNKDRTTPTPCWEIKSCPDDWRENCIVWKLKARLFCWYINGTFCQGKIHRNWAEKIQICRECEIFQSLSSTV